MTFDNAWWWWWCGYPRWIFFSSSSLRGERFASSFVYADKIYLSYCFTSFVLSSLSTDNKNFPNGQYRYMQRPEPTAMPFFLSQKVIPLPLTLLNHFRRALYPSLCVCLCSSRRSSCFDVFVALVVFATQTGLHTLKGE